MFLIIRGPCVFLLDGDFLFAFLIFDFFSNILMVSLFCGLGIYDSFSLDWRCFSLII